MAKVSSVVVWRGALIFRLSNIFFQKHKICGWKSHIWGGWGNLWAITSISPLLEIRSSLLGQDLFTSADEERRRLMKMIRDGE